MGIIRANEMDNEDESDGTVCMSREGLNGEENGSKYCSFLILMKYRKRSE